MATIPGPSRHRPRHHAALAQRLRRRIGLLAPTPHRAPGPREDAGVLASRGSSTAARGSGGTAELWLMWTALSAAHPRTGDEVLAAAARDVDRASDFAAWLLEAGPSSRARTAVPLSQRWTSSSTRVVVDVDFCAPSTTCTPASSASSAETVPRWAPGPRLDLVAWTDAHGAMRRHRRGRARPRPPLGLAQKRRGSDRPARTETRPGRAVAQHRRAAGEPVDRSGARRSPRSPHSRQRRRPIGYDCIPAISPS